MSSRILVTGGAGYIGSHTLIELIDGGYEPVVVDNLCNAKREALRRVERIAGAKIPLHTLDLRDRAGLADVFHRTQPAAVIHFAGLKAVGESVAKPTLYYDNNVGGSIALLQAMQTVGCRTLVFSSSATVYGNPAALPITEDEPLKPTNPYGHSKCMIEQLIRDAAAADSGLRAAILRYFNPVGAHASGLIGEDPNDIPNNLMPYIAQVAVGRLERLNVFGADYPTPDGTGVRDYIHVLDLARGHVAALKRLEQRAGVLTVNLGTGQGYSVMQMRQAFETAAQRKIPYRIAPRRPGDIAACYADTRLAHQELGWKAELGIDRMCADTWRWQQGNPRGYCHP